MNRSPAADDEDSIFEAMDTAWADEAEAAGKESIEDATRGAFEARVLRHILKRLGHERLYQTMAREVARRTGGNVPPGLDLLNAEYGLGIRLGVARVFWVHNLTLGQLFRTPEKTPIFQAFFEWADEADFDPSDTRPRGIIFRLPGCPGVGSRAILHDRIATLTGLVTKVVFAVERPAGTVTHYVLEPLDQFLAFLGPFQP